MSASGTTTPDVVQRWDEVAPGGREPLLVLDPLRAFLDERGLGEGPLVAAPIGDGHSNVTYVVDRGPTRLVVRRPPRGPLAPSTHDVLREARLLSALGPAGARVPAVLATSDDPAVLGAPFYVMPFLDGHVLTDELPAALAAPGSGAAIADRLVDALVELHAVDPASHGLDAFGRGTGYLARQVRRFGGLWDANATREVPDLDRVSSALAASVPADAATAVVHGDYRLGNLMWGPSAPPQIVGILDWEMATIGDPLADVGYLLASWPQAGDPEDPLVSLGGVSRGPGFPGRDALLRRYAERSGRAVDGIDWYRVLALWKAAIFLEGSRRRFLDGGTDDPFFASLEHGVPALAGRALTIAREAGLA
ncbi:phosphotransferase family protein [Patulibacter sp. NPDC049589]|uniref:phosphotransferase family protein n=1 Tax=Patulibacter sp. NPDC049589 TaxID=3154731 RepID=UPI0034133C52